MALAARDGAGYLWVAVGAAVKHGSAVDGPPHCGLPAAAAAPEMQRTPLNRCVSQNRLGRRNQLSAPSLQQAEVLRSLAPTRAKGKRASPAQSSLAEAHGKRLGWATVATAAYRPIIWNATSQCTHSTGGL